jgi:fructose-1,6-bisphosphatase/inositol monophosphatase family enzyme
MNEQAGKAGGRAYARELATAVELARKSGAAALSFYGGPLRIEHKGAPGDELGEPVTQADKAVNEMIVRGLAAVFPDDGILAEESVDTERRLGRER